MPVVPSRSLGLLQRKQLVSRAALICGNKRVSAADVARSVVPLLEGAVPS